MNAKNCDGEKPFDSELYKLADEMTNQEAQELSIQPTRSVQFKQQLGWDCFDVAIGLADILEIAEPTPEKLSRQTRAELVKRVLTKSFEQDYRDLLSPEIRHAAALTVEHMNTGSQGSNDYHLPHNMHTDELKNIVNSYFNAHGNEKVKEMIVACNDHLGNAEGKRLSLDRLRHFFQDTKNRNDNQTAYNAFNQVYHRIVSPAEAAFSTYCSCITTYRRYVQYYYGQQRWFTLQAQLNGEFSTSMVDVTAKLLGLEITIYDIYNVICYQTKSYGRRKIFVNYNGVNHFTKRARHADLSSVYRPEASNEDIFNLQLPSDEVNLEYGTTDSQQGNFSKEEHYIFSPLTVKIELTPTDLGNEGIEDLTHINYATEDDHYDVTALLENNVKINSPEVSDITPVQHAGKLNAAPTSIEQDANINDIDKNSMKSLQHVAEAGKWNVVKYLVAQGADIDTVDKNGMIPISLIAKENKWDIAIYLVERGAEVYSLTNDQRVSLLKHLTQSNLKIDQCTDSEVSKALYATICLNNAELFETLIDKWKIDYLNNSDTKRRLDNFLPIVYEEIRLKDVPLSKKMEFVVEDEIIRSRFFTENSDKNKKEVQASLDDVKQRMKMVCVHINELSRTYSGEEEKEVDGEFLLIARFVGQNIHVLKRQLRSTYNKLPWEEMEFYLVNFISSCLNPQGTDIIHALVLDKERLLNHLVNFREIVTKIEEILCKTDVNSKFPKQVDATLSPRNEAVKSVITMWKLPSGESLFQELYNDHELIKNAYSLKRMQSYTRLALSIDLEENNELGGLVIEKTLQVLGESLKNTLESPNLSDDIHRVLLYSAPKNIKEIITSLRNSLSHTHTLTKKIKLEDKNYPGFFHKVQNDFKKIEAEIADIIYQQKFNAIKMFLNKIIHCKDLAEVKRLCNSINRTELEEIQLVDTTTKEFKKSKTLIEQLRTVIKNQTHKEKYLFSEIKKIFDSQETKLADFKLNYGTKLSDIKRLVKQIYYSDNLNSIQNISRRNLSIMRSNMKIEKLQEIILLVENIIDSVEQRAPASEQCQIIVLYYKILSTMEFEAGRIKSIDEFKAKLEEKANKLQVTVQEKVESVCDVITKDIKEDNNKNIFQNELRKKQKIHGAKQELSTLLTELEKGSVTMNSSVKDQYDSLIKTLGISKTKKEKFKKQIDKGEWEECIKLVDRLKSSYQTLLDSVKNSIENEKSYEMSRYFKEFVKSIISDDTLQKKLNIVINNNLKGKKQKFQKYFDKRLKILKQVVSFDMGKSKLIEAYKQDKALQAAVEILLLDLTEILENVPLFGDNRLFIDTHSPILIGWSLRNYLAHGDCLIDTLLYDPSIAIFSSALNFIEVGQNLVTEENKLIGQQILNCIGDLKTRFDKSLNVIINQKNMFIAVKEGNLHQVRDCIRKGADIKGRGTNGLTALNFAAAGVSKEMLYFLIDKNFNIDIEKDFIQNTLHNAASSGNKKFITDGLEGRELKDSNIDLNDRILLRLAEDVCPKSTADAFLGAGDTALDNMMTPLHVAAQNDNIKVVASLLEKEVNVNITPLHLAVEESRKEIEALIGKRVKVDLCSNDKWTPLHLASQEGQREVVEALIKKGDKVNVYSNDNWSPLHLASQESHTKVVEVLIRNGANVDASNNDNRTSLHMAAQSVHREVVDALVRKGASVDARDEYNMTPLHLAAILDHKEVVKALIEYGANVDAPDKDNWTPLHFGAYRGNKEVVEELIERGATLDASGEDWTPLHLAVLDGHIEVIEVLLRKGANVDASGKHNCTPLHFAVHTGYKEVVEILLEKGANVDAPDKENWTPLHVAAQFNHRELIEVLLIKRATVDAPGEDNWTPLHLASYIGHKDVVKVLLERGAITDALGVDNWTPLHLAAQNGHREVVENLLRKGATVDALGKDKWTPLHMAAQNGHREVVEYLLEKGATVDATDDNKLTPLHMASQNGHREVVLSLLGKEAQCNVLDMHHQTPLHLAARSGYREVVDTLIRKGAMVDDPGSCIWTSLHMAAQYGHKEVVEDLLGKGAKVNISGNDNRTPLHSAAFLDRKEVVEALLRKGSCADAADNDNMTPLHMAAITGAIKVVEALLGEGAKIDASNKDNFTPLQFALYARHKEVVEALLEKGAKVNAPGNDNWTPLHLAALNGERELVEDLLRKGAQIDAPSMANWTALHIAAEEGHLDVVDTLLGKGAMVDALAKDNKTPLHIAAQIGHREVVGSLIKKGASVNTRDEDDMTPLHLAAQEGHKYVVKDLLTNGAKADAHGKNNWTPLHFAAYAGCNAVVDVLLEKEANVDAPGESNCTPLHVAAQNGHTEIVRALIEKGGANVGAPGKDSLTPLHMASQNGYTEVVEALIENGAVVDALDKENLTPLHFAAQNGHREMVDILIEKGAKIDALDEDNMTPLHFAAQNDYNEVVEVLLKKGANIDASTIANWTALHMVAEEIHMEVAKTLLKNGAKVDALGMDNKTPLHIAVQNGHREMVQALIEKEASVDARDKDNMTPLHLAVQAGHRNVVKDLLRKGANIDVAGKDNWTSLHLASYIGNTVLVEILLKKEATVDALGESNCTPLHLAAQNGHVGVVTALLEKGATVDAPGKYDWTPLHFAVYADHKEVVEVLLEKGSTVDSLGEGNLTPLHLAARKGHSKVVQSLLRHGAKVDTILNDNSTSLHLAAQEGHWEVVKDLLEKGAVVDTPDDDNMTPLHIAVQEGHKEVVEVLIEKGADFLARNNHDTVLHQAVRYNDEDILKIILDEIKKRFTQDVRQINQYINAKDSNCFTPLMISVATKSVNSAQILLDYGADIDGPGQDNWTPLHMAAEAGYKEVLEVLLDRGANVNAFGNDNFTPLHAAARRGHREIVESLLGRGANFLAINSHDTVLHQAASGNNEHVVKLILDRIKENFNHDTLQIYQYINAKDTEGDTPLMWAAQNGKVAAVRVLLEYSASRDVKNNVGMTALHWAEKNGHVEVIKLLINNNENSI